MYDRIEEDANRISERWICAVSEKVRTSGENHLLQEGIRQNYMGKYRYSTIFCTLAAFIQGLRATELQLFYQSVSKQKYNFLLQKCFLQMFRPRKVMQTLNVFKSHFVCYFIIEMGVYNHRHFILKECIAFFKVTFQVNVLLLLFQVTFFIYILL